MSSLLSDPNEMRRPVARACRIVRFNRVVPDLHRAEAFYRDALGFRTIPLEPMDLLTLEAVGPGRPAADAIAMRLGQETLALVRFETPGLRYPPDSRSNDLWFQHLAVVVGDMDAAYAHLACQSGWQPIGNGGPQQLPPSVGGVRAFKFRDPFGHPLELIWFPPGQGRPVWHESHDGALFLGIDHSALSIRSTFESQTFYRSLGLRVSSRSFNHGAEQANLDGLNEARVRVTGLRPESDGGPGLELLEYQPPGRGSSGLDLNNMVTDWVTLTAGVLPDEPIRMIRDPDGHLLMSIDQSAGRPA